MYFVTRDGLISGNLITASVKSDYSCWEVCVFVHSEELNWQDKVLRLFSLYPVHCKLYELCTVSAAVGTQITSLVHDSWKGRG